MTKRLLYPQYWAQNGTATDPDLDTTAPSYIADRYATKGWESEKPPEDWQNFLSQITDVKIINNMVDGIPPWDTSVAYVAGSVCSMSGKFWVAKVVPTKAPGIDAGWEEILSVDRVAYLAFVQAMDKLIKDHLAADNPHNDTIQGLVGGGYDKGQVDAFFGSATDPKTIVYHKLQMGAGVHGETAVSVGTLPAATGGTFTGDVIFLDEAIIQLTPAKSVHYNKTTALFEIVNGTYSLGVDPSGNGYIVGTGGAALILSEKNLDSITIKYNNQFALPVPVWSANFESDISDGGSIGCWTLDTSAAPVFVDGGLKVDDNTCTITFDPASFPVTLVMSVKDKDGTWRFPVVDYPTWTIAANTTNLFTLAKQMYPAYNPECVGFYKIYPRLSALQKTMLVNK